MKEVYDFLDSNKIEYNVVEHPEVFNTNDADKYVEGYEGVLTKSIFIYKESAFSLNKIKM